MKIPCDIALHKKSRDLELFYEGEAPVRLSFEFLRVMSPSAEVQGHTPDQAKLQVGKRLVDIVAIEPIGNYAIAIKFSDGHDSGLYSWDYLEHLALNHDELWAQYLQAIEAAGASRDPDDPAIKPFEPKPKRSCSHH